MLVKKLGRQFLLAIFLLLGCIGCQQRQTELSNTFRIGILSGQNTENFLEMYQPLMAHLGDKLGVEINLVAATSYGELLELFVNQDIDLANFGALTYLQAKNQIPVNAIVMRDIDARFTSYFIVHKEKPHFDLAETRGLTLLFGSKVSTSGHLMPRFFLEQQNIHPESFYSQIKYTGNHDQTIEQVAKGLMDVGAVNASVFDRLIKQDHEFAQNTRAIWETPPYVDYMWTMQAHYTMKAAHKVRDAFLSLSYNNPRHQIILDKLSSKGFLPVVAQNLTEVDSFARSLGLIED